MTEMAFFLSPSGSLRHVGVRVTAWAGMYGTMSLAAAVVLSFIVEVPSLCPNTLPRIAKRQV